MGIKLPTYSLLLAFVLFGIACAQPGEEHQSIPEVVGIYPSADTLPSNLLRMYLHFSKAMKTTGNLEKIKLVDETNQEVVGAIFNNAFELWNPQQTQLTLLFDPARVKTGLVANQQMGRALQAGKRYKLVIGNLEDVYGNPLAAEFTKAFFVRAADKKAPNIKSWNIYTPKVGSRSPLIVQFPTMLDRFSLLKQVQLTDAIDQPIDGLIEIKNQETAWYFTPVQKWSEGSYVLHVHTRLEDPAGNNLNGLFDHKEGTMSNSQKDLLKRIPFKLKEP